VCPLGDTRIVFKRMSASTRICITSFRLDANDSSLSTADRRSSGQRRATRASGPLERDVGRL